MINNSKFSALEIAKEVNGALVGNDVFSTKISINSKEKSADGHCFFAIKGEKYDGADFIGEAISNGAKIIVTQNKIRYPVSVIYVADAVKAFGLLARGRARKLRVVGVTGSYGKTCVKDMIISVLSERYRACGTEQNYNNEIGVPLTLLSAQDVDFCVVEMGMRALGEIEWLSYIAEPELSVITSCGTSHIERLGSMENIFKAKTEILKHTRACCVLPSQKSFYELENNLKKIYVGECGDFFANEIRREGEKIKFKIKGQDFELNSIYEHNAKNAAFAYAVGKYYSLTDSEIKNGLLKWQQRENRGATLDFKGITVVNDCYNASYESVISAIYTLSTLRREGGRCAVLLGDMLEQGEEAKRLHTSVGSFCKECGVEFLFTCGANAQWYIEGFGGGEELKYGEIKNKILNTLAPGDALLVKASHAMNFDKIINDMREK